MLSVNISLIDVTGCSQIQMDLIENPLVENEWLTPPQDGASQVPAEEAVFVANAEAIFLLVDDTLGGGERHEWKMRELRKKLATTVICRCPTARYSRTCSRTLSPVLRTFSPPGALPPVALNPSEGPGFWALRLSPHHSAPLQICAVSSPGP